MQGLTTKLSKPRCFSLPHAINDFTLTRARNERKHHYAACVVRQNSGVMIKASANS